MSGGVVAASVGAALDGLVARTEIGGITTEYLKSASYPARSTSSTCGTSLDPPAFPQAVTEMHSPAMPLVALQEPRFCEETQGIAAKAANTTRASRIVLDAGYFCTQAL